MAAIVDTGDLSKPINRIFTRIFLDNARYQTVYFLGSEGAQVTSQQGSSNALWHRYEHQAITTTPLSELTDDALPTRPSAIPTRTDIEKEISKYGSHFTLNEEVETFNFNGTMAQLSKILGQNAGRSVNAVQRNEMEDNSAQRYAGSATSVATVNTKIVKADLDGAINYLAREVAEPFTPQTTGSTNINTTPLLPSYYAICHPDVAYDISEISGFVEAARYSSQVETLTREVGYLRSGGFGIRVVQTADSSVNTNGGATGGSNVNTTGGSGGADVYSTVVYGQGAYGSLGLDEEYSDQPRMLGNDAPSQAESMGSIMMIAKALGSAGTADPLNELSTVGWKAWAAAKVLNDKWGLSIRSAATDVGNVP